MKESDGVHSRRKGGRFKNDIKLRRLDNSTQYYNDNTTVRRDVE